MVIHLFLPGLFNLCPETVTMLNYPNGRGPSVLSEKKARALMSSLCFGMLALRSELLPEQCLGENK